MIAWFKAWRRTRAALRSLKRDIDVLRIQEAVHPVHSISALALELRGPDRLTKLCKEYLIVKRLGADAAVLHKLSEVR